MKAYPYLIHDLSSQKGERLSRLDPFIAPFDGKGGIGKMVQLFGDEMDPIIDEMNEALAA